jgi:hypothetical protein
MITPDEPQQIAINALLTAGFDNGWVLTNGVLVLWEHNQEPPAPLTRPDQQPAPTPLEP